MKRAKNISISVFTLCLILIFNIYPNIAAGETNDGRIEINNGLLNNERLFNDFQRLAPSQVVSSKKIAIKNTGSFPIKMHQKYLFELKDDRFSKEELEKMLGKYSVKIHIFKKGQETIQNQFSSEWTPVTEVNSAFFSEQGKELATVGPQDSVSIVLDIKLDEQAGNEFQGVLFNASLNTLGFMEVSNNGFSLPVTASNQYNLIILGFLLLALGLSFLYKRKKD